MQYPGLTVIGCCNGTMQKEGTEMCLLITKLNRCLVELADVVHVEPLRVSLAVGGA